MRVRAGLRSRPRAAAWAVFALAFFGGAFVANAARASGAQDSIVQIEASSAASNAEASSAAPDITATPHATSSIQPVEPAVKPAAGDVPVVETGTPDVTTTLRSTAQSTTTVPAVDVVAAVAETPGVTAATEIGDVIDVTDEKSEAVSDGQTEATDDVVAAVDVGVPTNQSSCRADLPGAVMTIAIPDISYWCPVYAGGQAVIDAGVATVITAAESSLPLATHAGGAGTLWITGHRSSHRGPFAAVPDLGDGAIITVSDSSGTASYVIVGRIRVEVRDGLAVDASGQTTESATLDAVLRPDRGGDLTPRLLLQTCDGDDFRWMIYADLIDG